MPYGYNADYRLEHRVDAKGQKTAYEYDDYGRLSAVKYYLSGMTQDEQAQRVSYTYDTQSLVPGYTQYGWGRLAAVEFTAGQAMRDVYNYNQAGRVTGRKMQVGTGSNNWLSIDAGYSYDNEGRVTQMTHPDGTAYTYGFDSMGRLNSMAGSATATATYGVAGQITSMSYLGIGETRQYNDLLQMTRLTASDSNGTAVDMEYRFAAGHNNGRIGSAKDYVSGEEVSYTYDSLNRLVTASTTGPAWGLRFSYDGFGNLTDRVVTKGSAPAGAIGVDPGSNRRIGEVYDANGNPVGSWQGQAAQIYDVENRLVMDNPTGTAYGYDHAGKRVWKSVGVRGVNYSAELYVYGVDGKRLATYTWSAFNDGCQCDLYNLTGSNLYFGGKLIKSAGQAVVTDRLGSVRWKANGERYHYFPYGEQYASDSTASKIDGKDKFGTYFRDGGLDYADQRYYASGTGRFLTADPYQASGGAAEPGSWNRYSYVQGDPVNYYDPFGLFEIMPCGGLDPNCTKGQGSGGSGPGSNDVEVVASEPGGGGGAFLTAYLLPGGLKVTDPAASRKINRTITALKNALDPDCASWLETSKLAPTRALLESWIEEERAHVGKAGFSTEGGDPDPKTVAQADINVAGGFNILFNTGSGFFTGGGASGFGDLNYNTDRFRIFSMIHEFAHELGVPGFRAENKSQQITKENNDQIFKNCGKTLGQFSNGMI